MTPPQTAAPAPERAPVPGRDAAQRHRSRRVLRRQRQAGGALLRPGFGFSIIAYAGPETGMRDRVSYVLEQGAVRFVVTGALDPDADIAAPRRRARRRRQGHRPRASPTSTPPTRRPSAAAPRGVPRADDDRGRARHPPAGRDRHLRRDHAHLRRARRLHGAFRPASRRPSAPDGRRRRPAAHRPRRRQRRAGHARRVGRASTSEVSASTSSSTSTTSRSAPSTRR